MLLGDILHSGVIRMTLEADEKFACIRELVDVLIDSGDLTRKLRDHVLDVVTARERSMGTGMEQGVALPHGTSDRIDRVLGAMGFSPAGIDFDSLDGQAAKLVLLLVLPRHRFQAHVRTLAGISHLLNDDDFREALLESVDAEAVMKLIHLEESRIGVRGKGG